MSYNALEPQYDMCDSEIYGYDDCTIEVTGYVLAKVKTKTKYGATNERIVKFLGQAELGKYGEFDIDDVKVKFDDEFLVVCADCNYEPNPKNEEKIVEILEIFDSGDFT